MSNTKNSWQSKKIFVFQGLLALLLVSFFIPEIPGVWTKIDLAVFDFFNRHLHNSPFLRIFLALTNHSLADWVEDICILGFYLTAIFTISKEKRLRKICEFIFCVLLTTCTILLMNRLLCRDLLELKRKSPTLTIPGAVKLSDYFDWLTIKKSSSKSFPGDHATTALMFACTYAWYVRGRLALLALLYAGFLCLPRLAVGAHWLSDIIVGSGSIILLSLTWSLFTPFSDRCIQGLQKLFLKWKWKKKPSPPFHENKLET